MTARTMLLSDEEIKGRADKHDDAFDFGEGAEYARSLYEAERNRLLDEIERLSARLEATEEDRSNFLVEMGKLCAQCDALRAKVESIERQEPVAWLHETRRDSDVVTDAVKHVWGKVAVGSMAAYSIPLCALPGAHTQGEEK